MKREKDIEQRAESQEQRAKSEEPGVILSGVEGCTLQLETIIHSHFTRSSSPLMKGVSTKETGDVIMDRKESLQLEGRRRKIEDGRWKLEESCGWQSQFTLCPLKAGHLPQGRMSEDLGFPALSSWHLALGYFFTLCPVTTEHLPQGRMSDQLRFLARDSQLATRSYLKRNSTVKINNKLLKWSCIYNASFPVPSNTGIGVEEPAIRACDVLLN